MGSFCLISARGISGTTGSCRFPRPEPIVITNYRSAPQVSNVTGLRDLSDNILHSISHHSHSDRNWCDSRKILGFFYIPDPDIYMICFIYHS